MNIEIHPVMVPEDLTRVGGAIEAAVNKYASRRKTVTAWNVCSGAAVTALARARAETPVVAAAVPAPTPSSASPEGRRYR